MSPTGLVRVGPDQTRVSDKVRGLCLVGFGRAGVVEFSYKLTIPPTFDRQSITVTVKFCLQHDFVNVSDLFRIQCTD